MVTPSRPRPWPHEPFRFGIVAGYPADLTAWTAQAKRVEDLGFDTLLATDPVAGADPFVLLGAAAAVTGRHARYLCARRSVPGRAGARLAGSDAAPADRRPVRARARCRAAGRRRARRHLGREFPAPGERVTRMAETIAHLKRSIDRPRLLLSAGGPKMLALAAQEADTVTFTWRPRPPKPRPSPLWIDSVSLPTTAAGHRARAEPDRRRRRAVAQVARCAGFDVPELAAGGAVTVLPSDPVSGGKAPRLAGAVGDFLRHGQLRLRRTVRRDRGPRQDSAFAGG